MDGKKHKKLTPSENITTVFTTLAQWIETGQPSKFIQGEVEHMVEGVLVYAKVHPEVVTLPENMRKYSWEVGDIEEIR